MASQSSCDFERTIGANPVLRFKNVRGESPRLQRIEKPPKDLGGWRYLVTMDQHKSDLSVTSWQMHCNTS